MHQVKQKRLTLMLCNHKYQFKKLNEDLFNLEESYLISTNTLVKYENSWVNNFLYLNKCILSRCIYGNYTSREIQLQHSLIHQPGANSCNTVQEKQHSRLEWLVDKHILQNYCLKYIKHRIHIFLLNCMAGILFYDIERTTIMNIIEITFKIINRIKDRS